MHSARHRWMRRAACALLVLLLLAMVQPAMAVVRIGSPLGTLDLGTWDGVSGGFVQADNCIISTSGNPNAQPPIPYRPLARVVDPNSGSTNPSLPLQVFSTSNPAFSAPITLTWTDLDTGVSEDLAANTPGSPKTGRTRNRCNSLGDNGRLRFSYRSADLAGLPPGTYQGEIELTVSNDNGDTDTGIVTVTLTIPGVYKIGNLNDLLLGEYAGAGDVLANEPFCVHANQGTYSLTVSSTTIHQGDATSFALENTAMPGVTIPYEVRVDEDSDASNGQVVSNGQRVTPLNGNPTSQQCAGSGDNAAVYVRLLQADILAVGPGDYSATLTLRVEPP